MKKEHAAFLIGGIAFGVLFGYGLFNALEEQPGAAAAPGGGASIPAPAGPAAPTQSPGGGAPMVAEVNELKRVLQQDPANLGALIRVGQLYGSIGMWESVDPFFEQAVEAAPGNAELPLRLANFLHDARQWERAIAFYDRALEFRPDDPNVLTDKGICLRGVGRFEEALEVMAKAHQADPAHWQSLFNSAVVAGFDLGRFDAAEAALDRLEQIKPDAPGLRELRQRLADAERGAS